MSAIKPAVVTKAGVIIEPMKLTEVCHAFAVTTHTDLTNERVILSQAIQADRDKYVERKRKAEQKGAGKRPKN